LLPEKLVEEKGDSGEELPGLIEKIFI